MRSTEPALSTTVPTSSDPAQGASPIVSEASRASGRRRAAVAGETAPLPVVASVSAQQSGSASAVLPTSAVSSTSAAGRVAPQRVAPQGVAPEIDATISPRRAARAAREAAAALSAAQVPVSPMLAPASPAVLVAPSVVPTFATVVPSSVVPSTAAVVASVSPVDVESSAGADMTAGVAGAASNVSVEVEVEVEAAGPLTPTVVAEPARASHASDLVPAGRRETFLPATAGEAHRRSLQRGATAADRRRAALATRTLPGSSSAPERRGPGRVGIAFRRVAIVGVVAGILATTVLPVLEHNQGAAYAAGNTGVQVTDSGSQQVDVTSDSADVVAGRDSYGATSVVDYEKQVIANREAASSSTYTGPSAEYYQTHPLYSHTPLDRSQVFDVALQYLGTPYVHGGADPSAFDCSGFIMFVYAQFGITLAHYVPTQNLEGTTIPQSEAVPGDLVIFDNGAHDGFYAGNGMILDAPKPGGVVSVRPIWNQAHHFVRIGS